MALERPPSSQEAGIGCSLMVGFGLLCLSAVVIAWISMALSGIDEPYSPPGIVWGLPLLFCVAGTASVLKSDSLLGWSCMAFVGASGFGFVVLVFLIPMTYGTEGYRLVPWWLWCLPLWAGIIALSPAALGRDRAAFFWQRGGLIAGSSLGLSFSLTFLVGGFLMVATDTVGDKYAAEKRYEIRVRGGGRERHAGVVDGVEAKRIMRRQDAKHGAIMCGLGLLFTGVSAMGFRAGFAGKGKES